VVPVFFGMCLFVRSRNGLLVVIIFLELSDGDELFHQVIQSPVDR